MDLRESQIVLLRKFAHLYDSGVPLTEALELASAEVGNALQEAVSDVVEDLFRGSSLADAMARRTDTFGPEIVGILRSGEQRGELGAAARNAAAGLEGRVLEPRSLPEGQVDGLLANAGDARAIHLEPPSRVRLRAGGRLSEGFEADATGLAEALARLAGIEGGAGEGSFLWRNRLVRVSTAPTGDGTAAVAWLSAEPGPEPKEARAWREGRPGLLVVHGGRHADLDAPLRAALAAFDATRMKCVSVDLPVPEVAACVPALDMALAMDPDVVCVARWPEDEDPQPLVDAVAAGMYVAVSAPSPRPFAGLPCRVIRA
ncbi:MAG TPA: type II secretion system F family protein [Planctomycetota bacterium]|nr:type II secretion system F family protein [Planctomycetota bacterium]